MGTRLLDTLGNVVNVAVKVLILLIILAIGWAVARWIRKGVRALLHRVGFDRAIERGGLHRMLGAYGASDLAARLVQFAFMLLVLQLALGIFGSNPVNSVINGWVRWLPRLFAAVLIVIVAAWIAGWVRDFLSEALAGLPYGRGIAGGAQALIVIFGVVAALNQIGVANAITLPIIITALATLGGILVVGLGGGLIRPMQHRWERILNRAETQTSFARSQYRANRAAMAERGPYRDFDQPAYTGGHDPEYYENPAPTSTSTTGSTDSADEDIFGEQ